MIGVHKHKAPPLPAWFVSRPVKLALTDESLISHTFSHAAGSLLPCRRQQTNCRLILQRVGTTVHHALHYPLIPLWFYVELLSIQIASTLLEYNKQLIVEYEVANTFHGWKFPSSEHKRSSICSPQSHPFTHLTTNTWVFHFFCLSLTALHFQGLYKTVSSYIQQELM